jgi:RNA polymerase sigma-70 factor (ECF subfamily)
MVDTAPGPEQAAIRSDEQQSMTHALKTLSEEHREILVLREIEEMSYGQIASITNIALGTVMSRLARARAALRERWIATAEGERYGV